MAPKVAFRFSMANVCRFSLPQIVGCITKPLPIGGTTLAGLVVTVLVGLAPLKDVTNAKGMVVNQGVLSSFGNSAAWLIAMAFIMAHGIVKQV